MTTIQSMAEQNAPRYAHLSDADMWTLIDALIAETSAPLYAIATDTWEQRRTSDRLQGLIWEMDRRVTLEAAIVTDWLIGSAADAAAALRRATAQVEVAA